MVATAQDFLELVGGLRGGSAAYEAAASLSELLEAVKRTAKGGTLTLQLKVEPLTAGDTVSLRITDALTLKAPRLPVGATVMYRTEDGRLSARDPRQPELPGLREVTPQGPVEVREVSNG